MKLHSLKVAATKVFVTEHEVNLIIAALCGEPIDSGWDPVVQGLVKRFDAARREFNGADDAEGT